ERRPVHAAQRLDRVPGSRWRAGGVGRLVPRRRAEALHHAANGGVAPAPAAVVIGTVPAGLLADREGRKRVMVGGPIVYSILTFLTGFAPDIAAVITLRVLAGFAMGAVFPLPYAYAAELCPPAVRGRFTGIADSFLSVGYFLSPRLGLLSIPP